MVLDRPNPPEPEDIARWNLTALRERMLIGDWYEDLRIELSQFFAPEVLARMTHPDVTRNPQKSFNVQKNVLYNDPPVVVIETGEGEATEPTDLDAIIRPELWPLRQRCHLLTLGLRESFMRLDWHEGGGIGYRIVSPAWVTAWATPAKPTVPVVVRELRLRKAEGEVDPWWVWETWDLRDPKAPVFKVEINDSHDAKKLIDVTLRFAKEGDGPYPYLRTNGEGILPWVLYHACVSDQLFGWQEQRELVDGTLKVGALWTLWFHGCRDCSHPQRVGLDVEAPAATNTQTVIGPVDKIALDQSAILLLNSKGGRNGSLTTLAPAMDPKAMADAIMAYEAGLSQEAGISPADLQVGGSAGMSGYAIVVSRDGLRTAQRSQIPSAMMGDQQLLATAAMLANAYGDGGGLPEDPEAYAITYADLGKSAEEIKGDLAEIETLTGAGLIGPIDAIQRVYPQLDRDSAIQKVVDIQRQQAEIDAALVAAGFAPQTAVAPTAAMPMPPTDIPPTEPPATPGA